MAINGDEYVPPDGWERVEIPAFADAPFAIWVNHFKSNSDRLNAIIKDPRRFLTGQQFSEEFGSLVGESIEGVTATTRVSTWLTNHENTLMRMVLYAIAIVSTSENTVAVTMYKHGPGGS